MNIPSPTSRLRPGSRPEITIPHFALRIPHLRRAFTLVEIMIAMGILALVLAAIYSSWTAILRASKVGLDAAAAVQRARIAGRMIEETLGSVESFAANQRYYGFVAENGSEPRLEFVTRLSPSFPRNGKFAGLDVRRVIFSVERGELMLRQKPYLWDDMDEDEKNYPLVLAKNVREFKTEFWDTRLGDWMDEWKQTNQIPTLVKVTLKLADNPYSTQVGEEVTRVVSIPAVMVAPAWQMPRPFPGAPGVPGAPGTPGAIPGNPIPGSSVPGTAGNPNVPNPGGPMFPPR
ncbi:MAG TPA: type II secretion system protein GspJ [Candidatus Limnocylindrales bacterium]|jgi:type II secretion system protein J|nr:type II secretion system protein GspJ [Candidatus Limnocylindrales bacterium]